MARLGRLERPTSGSGDQRSIQLSYRRAGRLPQVYEDCGSVQHEKKDACTKLILSLI